MLNRYDLYELAVQAPKMQAKFLRALHAGQPRTLREDFCGPASIARAWVALDPSRRAIGVDRDPEPIEHARAKAAEDPAVAAGIRFEIADVRTCTARADIIAAFNFACCELTERGALLEYLRAARASLEPGGLLAVDLYGGARAFEAGRMSTDIDTPQGRVRYEWEQRSADPITGRVENAMHFRLPDGRKMRDAFVYHWRLWSAPEMRDAMAEAGFASSEAHLGYGDAIDEEGSPVPTAHQPGQEIDGDFVVYVVGRV